MALIRGVLITWMPEYELEKSDPLLKLIESIQNYANGSHVG
jgi:hypothetical protein